MARVVVFAAEGIEALELAKTLDLEVVGQTPFKTLQGQATGHKVLLLETGIGKTAAGLAVGYAVTSFKPDWGIWAGVAGALDPSLKVFDVLVAHDAVQHDFDLTAFGRAPGELATGQRFIEADATIKARLLAACARLGHQARVGRIASGDCFMADEVLAQRVHTTFEAQAIEMEGAAALWAANTMGLPLGLLRSISDASGQEAKVSFEQFIGPASQTLSTIVRAAIENQ